MKIRTQFFILVAGIVLVPILSAFAFYGIQRLQDAGRYEVPAYDEIAASAGGSLERAEWDKLAGFIARRRNDMHFIVIGEDRRVIFSTTAEFSAGGTVTDEGLIETLRTTGDRYRYLFDSPIALRDRDTLVVMRLDRAESGPPSLFAKAIGASLFVIAALFAFSSAMSILIARSIYRSVMTLESSTRRIAAGELDVAVYARGSNEITSLTDSLNSMRLALKDEEIRRARFIMGVSHDLKTPLALIKGYAEAIGDGMAGDPESLERSVEIIGTKVDQLEGMIDDLIGFVKVNTGEWRRKLEPVELEPFIASYAKRVRADAELLDRRSESRIDLPAGLAVPMDDRLVVRALENLVNNAVRYTAPGGLVRIDARSDGGRVFIEIADDGPGIDAGEIERIFDPFYRGSSSRREQGMGLGLSVVKGVVDSHGWDISVASIQGEGSVFRISIPLPDKAAPAPADFAPS